MTSTEHGPVKKTLIELKGAEVAIKLQPLLKNFFWELKSKENWTIIGPNGSGKSLLAGLIAGRFKSDKCIYHVQPDKIIEISFAVVQETLDYEAWNDDSEFIEGGLDKGRSVEEFICEGGYKITDQLRQTFQLDNFLKTGLKFISNGEMRKAHILRALVREAQILILDGVYEGLDLKARTTIGELIENLPSDTSLINFVQDSEQISSASTHILCLDQCQKIISGPRERVLASREFAQLFKEPPPSLTSMPPSYTGPEAIQKGEEIIRMEDLSVIYGEKIVIDAINWSVNAGEHWCISGPNGAGKTTLLSLISADNAQAYGKKLWLFGRKRGSGESIWDIKKRIGVVTTELQLEYHQNILAEDVVVSGFFDSIGLYRQAEVSHEQIAREWMEKLGLADIAKTSFERLSYGERRSVLLARAMVKSPNILILDEPCQGLDRRNRTAILNTIEFLANNTEMTILYVSHKPEAQVGFIKHHLNFEAQETGPCKISIN